MYGVKQTKFKNKKPRLVTAGDSHASILTGSLSIFPVQIDTTPITGVIGTYSSIVTSGDVEVTDSSTRPGFTVAFDVNRVAIIISIATLFEAGASPNLFIVVLQNDVEVFRLPITTSERHDLSFVLNDVPTGNTTYKLFLEHDNIDFSYLVFCANGGSFLWDFDAYVCSFNDTHGAVLNGSNNTIAKNHYIISG